MHCLSCGTDNLENNKFCTECGSRLINTCPDCSFENKQNAKFCAACGSELLQGSKADKTKSIDRELDKPVAERKQLTVMFCDLVGSTSLSEKLDPEEYRDILRTYQEISTEVIDRVDGYIAQHLGDGLLVYFGYPISYEDNADRAVRAGLGIINGLKKEDFSVGSDNKIKLSVRIGIHTGLVVVDEIGSTGKSEQLALGDVPNISARIQSLGKNNKITISGSTHKLIENKYESLDLGEHSLKGITTPINLYQIEDELKENKELKKPSKSLTPIIGRENEVELLLERWDRVKESEGHVVLISGEAGIGKSRLAYQIKQEVKSETNKVVESRCSPYFINTYLFPIVDALQKLLFKSELSDIKKNKILKETLSQIEFYDKEVLKIVSDLLTAPINQEDKKKEFIKSQKQKQMTFDALIMCLLKKAEGKPMLIIIEDLHWSDLSTQEYIDQLIDHIRKEKVLLVLTFRSEFKPPWNMRSNISHIALNRLTKSNVEQMIANINKEKVFPPDFLREIVYKTDGIPLYVEELTKMLIESDSSATGSGDSHLKIPETIQDSLMARLDKLPEGKGVAQLGATFGREFTYDLISTVSDLEKDSLQKGLHELVDSEILYQKGVHPHTTFYFKHSLIQDAAYQSLLKSKRKTYHKKIARVAEKKMNEGSYDHPEYIAQHYFEAGLFKESIPYWLKSGENAVRRFAHLEAINHIKKGLDVINLIESDSETDQNELSFLSLLGGSLRVIKGFGVKEIEAVYFRMRELSKKIGDTPQLFHALRGLSGYYIAKSELNSALKLAYECLKMSDELEDSSYMVQANYLLGATLLCMGEFKKSDIHSNKGFVTYNPKIHKSFTHISGLNPGVACLYWKAYSKWFLGYPEQAKNVAKNAIELSIKSKHIYSQAIAYDIFASISLLRREPEQVREYVDSSIKISAENGFELFLAMGEILRGWSRVELGDIDNGIDETKQGIEHFQDTGSRFFFSHWNTILAESYIKNNQLEAADKLINETIENAEQTGELFSQAELYRNLAELCIIKNRKDKELIEGHFNKSIEIAVKQSSKMLELRSLVSYSRYLHSFGGNGGIIDKLKSCYDSFDEGFETYDLKEAKNLITDYS